MDYIIKFSPYKEKNIDIDYYADIERRVSEGKAISKVDADKFLRVIVYLTRKNINSNLDNYDNKCDLAQSILGHYLNNINCQVSNCLTLRVINPSVTGHSFSVLTLNVEGELTPYLIDATYIQFFKKDKCNFENYFVNPKQPNEVLLTPDPGYFIKEEDSANALFLLRYGYMELTLENAKMYGDSFLNTKRGFDEEPFSFKEMPGSSYIKKFFMGDERLSVSEEDLIFNGQAIETFNEQQKVNKSQRI